MKKNTLGKGLGALIPGIGDESSFADLDEILGETAASSRLEKTAKNIEQKSFMTVRLMDVEPCKGQPRTYFDEKSLKELAESIKSYGIIQPIIVRPIGDGTRYEIIAGERRWRAAGIAGLKEIPIVIRSLDGENLMELALVENLQRVDLNPIDEAMGYKALIDKHNLTHEQIAEKIGKNRTAISHSVKLLTLPQSVKELVETGDISSGHARALANLEDENIQKEIAERILRSDLSVRATERLIKSMNSPAKKVDGRLASEEMQIYLQGVEKKLEGFFGTKVRILVGRSKNKIEIEYYTNKDLGRILAICED